MSWPHLVKLTAAPDSYWHGDFYVNPAHVMAVYQDESSPSTAVVLASNQKFRVALSVEAVALLLAPLEAR